MENLLDETIDWRYKGFPPATDVKIRSIRQQRWNLFESDFLFPIMVLKDRALEHNIRTMAQFCETHDVSLAPHGKTTMAPQIIQRQLDTGSWAITAATMSQVRVFRRFGVERVLLANELVDPAALRWLAQEMAQDSTFSFLCLVDSERSVALMGETLAETSVERPVSVLVELGEAGTRAGSRSNEHALGVAEAVRRSPHLELAGVEGFEGVIGGDRSEKTEGAVRGFLERIHAVTVELDGRRAFEERDEIVVSAGGSVFFDQVARLNDISSLSRPLRVVLRSGCYVTHDHGIYDQLSPFGSRSAARERFRPALEIWGEVLSRPEPGLAILGIGKRDAPFDAGLPIPKRLRRRSGDLAEITAGVMDIVALNDQHAYLRFRDERVEVGDLVGCGISHPCTALDKWRLIPLVDDDYRTQGAVQTFF